MKSLVSTWTGDVVSVTGEVDLATSPQLRVDLTQVADDTLIVDLAGLTFIDASGLTVFIETAAKRDVRIVNPSQRVVRTFTLGNVQHLLGRPSDG